MNVLASYTPSKFGLSDAADLFVFLSGCTAAIVYRKNFERYGSMIGTLEVLQRCARLYVGHLQLFFLLALVCVLGNTLFAEPDYIRRLNINYFFDATPQAIVALASLRYVPHYLDILPMYVVILLLVPVVVVLASFHVRLALAFPVLLYLLTWWYGIEFPADPETERSWFFNPFCWQLIFFTGFALYSNWLKAPRRNRLLFALCCIFVLVAMPVSHEPTYRYSVNLTHIHELLAPWAEKSHYRLLRWLHFLALTYAVVYLLHDKRDLLCRPWSKLIGTIGQHALPMFQFASVLSYIGGMLLDQTHYAMVSQVAVTLGGCIVITIAASLLEWRKTKPWKQALVNEIKPEVAALTHR